VRFSWVAKGLHAISFFVEGSWVTVVVDDLLPVGKEGVYISINIYVTYVCVCVCVRVCVCVCVCHTHTRTYMHTYIYI
jgi:hypothetical protein